MNAGRIFLTGILFLSFCVHAIDESRTIRQVNLLVAKLKKEHVKPPVIDDAFGLQVNKRVLEYLDPHKTIFTAEDTREFERLSLAIDQDIEQQQLSYFSVVAKRFLVRLESLKGISETFLQTPVPLKSPVKISQTELDRFPAAKTHVERWKYTLQFQVMERMLARLDKTATQFPADSLASYEVAARKQVQEQYRNLFEELAGDASLLESVYLEAIALSFDPHSQYFSPSAKRDFEEELTPDRELYGFSFGKNASNQVVITDVFPGSPAWLSDELHEGDVVEQVLLGKGPQVDLTDGHQSLVELSKLFDEATGRTVRLTILDETGKRREVTLTKEKVYSDADVIKNAVLHGDKKIGYVTLPDFYVNWTDTSTLGCANDLAKCILKLKKENIDGLILDLRGNGGGSLREAVDLTGIFIDYGPVVALREKNGEARIMKDFNRGALYSGPLIVLIDEGSASASEVVAAALQDYNKALIVGRTSFGKATCQVVFPLDPEYTDLSASFMHENPDFGYANITTGLLYRVTRQWNQKKGVVPDVVLPFTTGLEEVVLERNYDNAILPDSLAKKIIFTPGPPLPVAALQSSSSRRLKEMPVFNRYRQLLDMYRALETADSLQYLDLSAELKVRNQWQQLTEQLDTYLDSLPLNFQPQANVFDSEIYKANNVLSQYHERFLAGLKTDIELVEAVNIMNELIEQEHH